MNQDLFETYQRLCHIKRHYLAYLNPYDRDFVCDLVFLLERGRDLTPRQQDHCALISDRIRRAEVAHEQNQ